MSVPRQRLSKARGGNRRSHDALGKLVLTKCQKCDRPVAMHQACAFCGTYKGKIAIKIKDKVVKKKES